MASGSTPLNNIPYPINSDPVNVQGDMQEMAERIDDVLDEFNTILDAQDAEIATIPTLIAEAGVEELLAGGLTWGQIKTGESPTS